MRERDALRRLLRDAFRDASDFDAFCLDHFPDVHLRFSDGMGRVARETLLLQHADHMMLRMQLAKCGAHVDLQSMPPNNLPARNKLFVGREEALAKLHAALRTESSAAIVPATVFGLGGLGKSTLALEFAYRHASDYPGGLWWARAEGEPAVALAVLAADLRLVGPLSVRTALTRVPNNVPAAELARAVRLALQNHGAPTLLVLDNVSVGQWRDHLPSNAVRVIVTTRDRALASVGEALPLEVLSDIEAQALANTLAGDVGDPQETKARNRVLREILGNLPVAVEVAARAVAQWHLTWSEYAAMLAKQPESVLEDETLRADYPQGVFAALDLSIARCGVDTAARRLLDGASVFAPEAIPMEWVTAAADLNDARHARSALALLEGLALLKTDRSAEHVSLHRLVHHRTRSLASRPIVSEGAVSPTHVRVTPFWDRILGGANRILGRSAEKGRLQSVTVNPSRVWIEIQRRALNSVLDWMRATVDDAAVAVVEARRTHIEAALAIGSELEPEVWSDLADRLGIHLWHRAELEGARVLFERALEVQEAVSGSGHPTVATRLSNLAGVYQELGELVRARSLRERVLQIDSATYGDDHPEVAIDLANLATVRHAQGDLLEARVLLERAVRIGEETLDENDPDLAIRLANLATIQLDLGNVTDARALVEHALQIDEAVYQPNHPMLAIHLSVAASVLRTLGNATAAREMYERALCIDEEMRGPYHPHVATRLSDLALALSDAGDFSGARLLLERALHIDEMTRDPAHWVVAVHLLNLALVLKSLGDAAAARPLLERALSIAESTRGSSHHRVASVLASLALVHADLGDATQARQLLKRALCIAEASLPPEHPDVALLLGNLAGVLRDLGEANDACSLLERALRIDEATYGQVHPVVGVHLASLARTLQSIGELARARSFLERALGICEAARGPDHHNVAMCLSDLGAVLQELGESTTARPLLERALRIDEAVFGSDHPSVARDLSHLALVLQDLGMAADACSMARNALAILEARRGTHHLATQSARRRLSTLVGPLSTGSC